MTDHMSTWDALADVDPKYTKPITGKPYKGTSPNPHYVVKMLTEHFGRVGEGWGIRVVSEGFQPMGDELLHWCRVEMWHSERSNTFEAYGQTKAIMKTRSGFMSDEDAPKKSFTDAMTKGASYIGAAANIFLGRYDDSKYVEMINEQFREAEAPPKPPRDPVKILDGLLDAVAKRKSEADLIALQKDAKFDAAWNWLMETDPDKGAEVTAAINAKLATFGEQE